MAAATGLGGQATRPHAWAPDGDTALAPHQAVLIGAFLQIQRPWARVLRVARLPGLPGVAPPARAAISHPGRALDRGCGAATLSRASTCQSHQHTQRRLVSAPCFSLRHLACATATASPAAGRRPVHAGQDPLGQLAFRPTHVAHYLQESSTFTSKGTVACCDRACGACGFSTRPVT